MSYDMHPTTSSGKNLLHLEIRHQTQGAEGTTVHASLTLCLAPHAIPDAQRVQVHALDLAWVGGPTVPDCAETLARILERLAAGLREGPGERYALLLGKTPPPPIHPTGTS